MAGLSGADIKQMQQLAGSIESRAQTIEKMSQLAGAGIRGSAGYWNGFDAAQFRQTWQTVHGPSLARCIVDLRTASQTIRRNADAQEETSRADGDGAGSGSGFRSFGGLSLPDFPDLPNPGDIADRAGDGLGWLDDQADRGREWVGDQAGAAWDRVSGEAAERWDDFTDWGRDRLGDVASAVGDRLIAEVLGGSRLGKLILNSGLPGSALGGLILGPIGIPLGGLIFREAAAPRLNDWWNESANPWLVGEIFERLDGRIGGDIPSGDLEAREPGGEFPVRTSGDGQGSPDPFSVEGNNSVDVGRNAVVRALEDTANGEQIQADEFQVVAHENGSYTVVLPGVTDLSNPQAGLSEHNRSVRDTDWAATRSAASASIDDNRYAQMVRDYIEDNVPPGSDIAIVGHSFGGDTALDLAADPAFNGEDFNVTHVVAAAYHSEPQLPHVQDGTEVLVLQNSRDIPVVVEEAGHASSIGEIFPSDREDIIVDEFTGGWAGAGHHQDNYIDRVKETGEANHEEFFTSWAEAGYGEDGEVTAVDVSVHESEVEE